MKIIEKEPNRNWKVKQIEGLMSYIELNFEIEITFDRRISNRYKLIVDGKESFFYTYTDVINALQFVINCGESK